MDSTQCTNINIERPIPDWFLNRVTVGDGCWNWQGSKTPQGYGKQRVGRTTQYTHRLSYKFFLGPIPEGLEIDHLCRNPSCCRPSHLEAVTHRINVHRGNPAWKQGLRKTHCAQGHPYDEANTLVSGNRRRCRTCLSANQRRLRANPEYRQAEYERNRARYHERYSPAREVQS